jgi:F-type H+-transporting ATPase subunit b
MPEVQNLGVISVNVWTVIISLCNLLIIFLIVKKLLFKPIKNVLEQRNAEIEKSYNNASEAMRKASDYKDEYEERLNNADDEADKIIKAANEKAGRLHRELISEAERKAEATMRRADEQIALEKKKAENDIKTQIAEVSVLLAEKLVDREINEKDHEAMINDFIDNVKR